MKKVSKVGRRFKCPCCGTVMTMPKSQSYMTKEGHIKTFWCYVCKKNMNFVQLSKWD